MSGADALVAKPPAGLRAALIYGADEGLVRERSNRLAQSVLGAGHDPLNLVEIEAAAAKSDPGRILDEAQAISMFGGRRLVRVRGAGDTHAPAIAPFVAAPPPGDAVLVVEAGDLARTSTLRKLFEGPKHAIAIACAAETPDELARLAEAAFRAAGRRVEAEAVQLLAHELPAERGIARAEIEKILLYTEGTGAVTEADVRASLAAEADLGAEEAADAALDGRAEALDRALARCAAEGVSEVQILRLALFGLMRLHLYRALLDQGHRGDEAARLLKPPAFGNRAAALAARARAWHAPAIDAGLQLLRDAEIQTKSTGLPAEACAGRALFQLARLATRSQTRR